MLPTRWGLVSILYGQSMTPARLHPEVLHNIPIRTEPGRKTLVPQAAMDGISRILMFVTTTHLSLDGDNQ